LGKGFLFTTKAAQQKIDPFHRNDKFILDGEKINLIQYLPGKFVKTIQLNENGMNEWIPQPSCMAEPMEHKTQSLNISVPLYQRMEEKIKRLVR
jgi:hypothetical protein